MVPDTNNYTKLFGLWKGKGNKLDLNKTEMQIGGIKGSNRHPAHNVHQREKIHVRLHNVVPLK